MIKFVKNYVAFRAYKKLYIKALKVALNELDTARQSVLFVNLKREDAFMWYTKVMDCSEEAMKIADDMVKQAIKHEPNHLVRQDIFNIARIYEQAGKIYAFVGAAISVIGEFQPVRAREVFGTNINYPRVENPPAR